MRAFTRLALVATLSLTPTLAAFAQQTTTSTPQKKPPQSTENYPGYGGKDEAVRARDAAAAKGK